MVTCSGLFSHLGGQWFSLPQRVFCFFVFKTFCCETISNLQERGKDRTENSSISFAHISCYRHVCFIFSSLPHLPMD